MREMDLLSELQKVIKLGKQISKFSDQDKDTVKLYINKWIMTRFDENEFDMVMLKYQIKYKFKIDYSIKELLKDREVLRLLLTSILHPNE